MAEFLGTFNHTLDKKGRMIVPSKFRKNPDEKFYVTAGIENCLYVFKEEEWLEFTAKLKAMPMLNPSARQLARRFYSMAADLSCDKLGRINIPSHLTEYAGIESEAKIVGNGTRFEIWSAQAWEKQDMAVSSEALAAQLSELDFL